MRKQSTFFRHQLLILTTRPYNREWGEIAQDGGGSGGAAGSGGLGRCAAEAGGGLLGQDFQAGVAVEQAAAISQQVGELALDVAEHLRAERLAVVGEQRIELGRGNNHGVPCRAQSRASIMTGGSIGPPGGRA